MLIYPDVLSGLDEFFILNFLTLALDPIASRAFEITVSCEMNDTPGPPLMGEAQASATAAECVDVIGRKIPVLP